MFGFTGIQELLLIIVVIAVLSSTGWWPRIIQGLRTAGSNNPTSPPKASNRSP